jgi:hypothetical protein
MNALIRAMLVGSVVGLAQVLLHLNGSRDLAANELPMFFLPLPLGMLLAWYGRLPRWWLVALLGQFAVIVLHVGMLSTVPASVVMHFGAWQGGLVLMLAGACGYAMGAGLAMPVNTALRVSAVGVAASLVLAAWSNQNVIALAALAQEMADEGTPFLAPEVPGYRLEEATNQGGKLRLEYELPDEFTPSLWAEVRPDAWSPQEACEADLNDPDDEECVEVSPGVWALHDPYARAVYTSYDDVVLVVTAEEAREGDLLAVLSSFRPVNALELAAA